MMGYYGAWGWMGLLGPLTMLVILVGLIALAVWAVRSVSGSVPLKGDAPTARDILDRRFAAGEIDVEEYERVKRALGDPAPVAR